MADQIKAMKVRTTDRLRLKRRRLLHLLTTVVGTQRRKHWQPNVGSSRKKLT